MRARYKGSALRTPERRLAYDITNEILRNNILREHIWKARGRTKFDIQIVAEEETNKGVIIVKPTKKKLTKEEKLALSKQLAGSARLFSKEGVEESLRIANREDWED
jgi:hypothetical protein